MRFHPKFLLVTALVSASLIATPNASALSSYQKKSVTKHLDSRAAQPNPKFFDGKKIVVGFDQFQRALTWYRELRGAYDKALRALKMLSSKQRKHPEARQLIGRLGALEKYINAVSPAMARYNDAYNAWVKRQNKARAKQAAALAEAKTKHTAACRHFLTGPLKSAQGNADGARIMTMHLKQEGYLLNAKQMKEHRAILQAVAAECAKPIAQDLPPEHGCDRYSKRRQRDPRTWCEIAKNMDGIMKGFARGLVKHQIWFRRNRSVQIDDPGKSEGWLSVSDPISYVGLTTLTDAELNVLKENVGPVFKAAGLSLDNLLDEKTKAEVLAFKSKLKASIDTHAPQHKTPKGKSHYSSKMAVKQVKARRGKGTKVVKHFLSKGWKVKDKLMKNVRTGALKTFPDYRYASGYVMTKDGPWCQLRQYTVYEYTKGASRSFRKAKEVELGYVRIQGCK